MTRGTMRAILRRRIDDPVPSDNETQWTNAELDEILNTAAGEIQAEIKAVDPEAFIRVTRSNIVADEPLVPKPQNSGAILDVKMLQDDGTYVSMGAPVRYDQVSEYPTTTTSRRYAMVGRWIYLAPTPAENTTDGLEWWFSETVEIPTGAASDTRTFPYDVALHDATVLKAQLILGPENDGTLEPGVMQNYLDAIKKIPLYYRRTLQPATALSPNITKTGQR